MSHVFFSIWKKYSLFIRSTKIIQIYYIKNKRTKNDKFIYKSNPLPMRMHYAGIH